MPRHFCLGSKIGIHFPTELTFDIVFTIFVLQLDFWNFCSADRTYFGDPFVWIRNSLMFMDQGFQLLCRGKARRLLFLLGATVAMVIVVQFLNFHLVEF